MSDQSRLDQSGKGDLTFRLLLTKYDIDVSKASAEPHLDRLLLLRALKCVS
jgi:hypothetical protein